MGLPLHRGRYASLVIDRSLFGPEHVRRYQETDGEVGYIWNGAPTLLLTTTGRRSGDPTTTPLIFGRDGDDFVLVASREALPSIQAGTATSRSNRRSSCR
jgi:hypothetical protein